MADEDAVLGVDPTSLYHLATAEEWAAYEVAGMIRPTSLATEGFVHCSWGRQVPGTIEKHFDGVVDLVVLEIDPAGLGDAALIEEDTTGSGQAFPHVHGPIPVSAVIDVRPAG